jgi:DNA modification methylase
MSNDYRFPGITEFVPTEGGTTGLAALARGRDFIGIEKDANYFAIASKRIAEAENATPLFSAAVIPTPASPWT